VPRVDGRNPSDLRPIRFIPDFIPSAPGSCLIECGRTRVVCTVSVESGVPRWMESRPGGWLTAEYAMLPGSTGRRKSRDRKGSVDGRTVEIQRLVGRVLRPTVDLAKLPPITLFVDCDVLEADGGTRTTAINGASFALAAALTKLRAEGRVDGVTPNMVGAASVGVVGGEVLLDLAYEEDSRADSDMNVVMDDQGGFLEVQASAERSPFSPAQLQSALDLAAEGIRNIFVARAECDGDA